MAIIVLILTVGYVASVVTVPVLLGLAMAYVLKPLLKTTARWGISPGVAAAAFLVVIFAVLGLLLWQVVPRLFMQSEALIQQLPAYADQLEGWIGIDLPVERVLGSGGAAAPATQESSLSTGQTFSIVTRSLEIAARLIGSALTLLVGLAVFVFATIYFAGSAHRLAEWLDGFLPQERRENVHRVLRECDRQTAAFIRGRLLLAIGVGIAATVGWAIADVPYYVMLGILATLLSVLPYAIALLAPILVGTVALDALATGEPVFGMTMLWAVLVYGAVQFVDAYIATPYVQSEQTNLDSMQVLIAVLVGGALFGAFGALVAIPVAASFKVVGHEWITPRLRSYFHHLLTRDGEDASDETDRDARAASE